MITTKTQVICVFVFVVSLLGAWLWLVFWQPPVSSLAHTTTTTFSQPLVTTTAPVEYFSSFSDVFSGTAWLDQTQTDLTRDSSGMVLTFKPNIEWQLLGDCSAMAEKCQAIVTQPAVKKLCLVGQQCLSIKNDQLIYQGRSLTLPGVKKDQLLDLKIELFADRWLVTAVQKLAEKQYQPLIWWFDGSSFKAVNLLDKNGQAATSQYSGQIAIGGRADSLLVLYSAYEGLAWQINGLEVRNLSYFFGSRVNSGGFSPKIISLGQGQATQWYVFDQSGQQARLLKFWQNKTDWIEGGLNLSASLPTGSQAVYLLANQDSLSLLAKTVDVSGRAKLWSVVDHGFIAPAIGQVTSVNLTAYDRVRPQIVGALVANSVGGWSSFNNQWFLSTDGKTWQPVKLGQRLNFQQPVDRLWWRWQVFPTTNTQQSPCLKMITINYYRL